MFSFLGLRKDSKKSTPDKEVDGGFVIIGETLEEQRQKISTMNVAQHSTNVVVRPYKPSCQTPSLHTDKKLPAALLDGGSAEGSPVVEAASALPDLLGDIPFTLAPHVIAMQAGFPVVSDVLLSFNVNYNLASYKYDFTLENSVLHNSPSV